MSIEQYISHRISAHRAICRARCYYSFIYYPLTHLLIAEGICYIIVGYVPLVYTEELLAYMYLDDELASIIILVTRPFFFNYTSRMSVHCYRNFFINKHIRHHDD